MCDVDLVRSRLSGLELMIETKAFSDVQGFWNQIKTFILPYGESRGGSIINLIKLQYLPLETSLQKFAGDFIESCVGFKVSPAEAWETYFYHLTNTAGITEYMKAFLVQFDASESDRINDLSPIKAQSERDLHCANSLMAELSEQILSQKHKLGWEKDWPSPNEKTRRGKETVAYAAEMSDDDGTSEPPPKRARSNPSGEEQLPCRLHLMGVCTLGQACPKKHSPKLAGLCPELTRGESCIWGRSCTHDHSGSAIAALPNNGRVCRDFMKGSCPRKQECPFLHSKGVQSNQANMCRDYSRGACTWGNECKYMHKKLGGNKSSSPSAPCYAFLANKCTRGNACRYAHIAADVKQDSKQQTEPTFSADTINALTEQLAKSVSKSLREEKIHEEEQQIIRAYRMSQQQGVKQFTL